MLQLGNSSLRKTRECGLTTFCGDQVTNGSISPSEQKPGMEVGSSKKHLWVTFMSRGRDPCDAHRRHKVCENVTPSEAWLVWTKRDRDWTKTKGRPADFWDSAGRTLADRDTQLQMCVTHKETGEWVWGRPTAAAAEARKAGAATVSPGDNA